MRARAWSNGGTTQSGAGYGVRITPKDRDRFFERGWNTVNVELPGDGTVEVHLSDSFWRNCTELRSSSIGRWLLEKRLAPWPSGRPPVLELTPRGNGHFTISSTSS